MVTNLEINLLQLLLALKILLSDSGVKIKHYFPVILNLFDRLLLQWVINAVKLIYNKLENLKMIFVIFRSGI